MGGGGRGGQGAGLVTSLMVLVAVVAVVRDGSPPGAVVVSGALRSLVDRSPGTCSVHRLCCCLKVSGDVARSWSLGLS